MASSLGKGSVKEGRGKKGDSSQNAEDPLHALVTAPTPQSLEKGKLFTGHDGAGASLPWWLVLVPALIIQGTWSGS